MRRQHNKLSRAAGRRNTKTSKDLLKSFIIPKRVRNWSPMKEARMLKLVHQGYRAYEPSQAFNAAAFNYFGE